MDEDEPVMHRPTPLSFAVLVLAFWSLSACRSRDVATEILWDTWGVPHIFGNNAEDAFRAFGWAQMHAHGNLVLRLYGQARGRGAEYWGTGYLETDRWVRTMDVYRRAQSWYEAQSPGFRASLDAFAEGMNGYAREHPDRIADEVELVLPVDAVDVLAHTQRVIHFGFVVGSNVARGAELALSGGSNTWAVGPSRSASGNTMLLQNPHLPWSGPSLFYEAHIVLPDVNVYGSTLVGFPVLAIAFNDHLGWSHTVNRSDGADLFELELVDGGYRWDGETRAFDVEHHRILVREPGGGRREEELTVRSSVHGPVVAESNGRAVALRVVGRDSPGMLEEWWDMGRAASLTEFEDALRRLQIPTFTVMYADDRGHILYFFGGRVPRRSRGDVNFWAGLVPGNTSDTLWEDVLSYEELPRLVDPQSGWLQNSNDPPWTSTHPAELDAGDFPPYVAPEFMHFRAQHSAQLLAEDAEISLEELLAYKHSTRMLMADRVLDDLIEAARAHGGPMVRRAADVLEAWDRNADAHSRGGVLFRRWADAWTEDHRLTEIPLLFQTRWDNQSPHRTPDGIADPMGAARILATTARELQETYGAVDVSWGEVYRIQYGGRDLPANGGPGEPTGILRAATFAPSDGDRFRIVAGDSYYAVIEFSDPVKARVLTAYGNATQPHSSHVGDQLELFAEKAMRPVWRTRSEIEQNLEHREMLSPSS
jgi:acyl-homoserine-lactone acylase